MLSSSQQDVDASTCTCLQNKLMHITTPYMIARISFIKFLYIYNMHFCFLMRASKSYHSYQLLACGECVALPVATGERELRGNASQVWLSKYLKRQCDHGKQTAKVGVHSFKKEYFGFKVCNSLLSLEQSISNGLH